MKKNLVAVFFFLTAFNSVTPLNCSSVPGITVSEVPFSYTVFNFNANEGWLLSAEGDKAASSLNGRNLFLDFSGGAKSISISPTPVSMLGRVEKIRLKVRGTTKDHSVHFYIQTHFMTFHKVVGKLNGSGEQELVIDAPPGNGWLWREGENDGEVHGPLRLLEIKIEGNNEMDECRLELISLAIEGKIAENKLCVMTSQCLPGNDPVTFKAKIRSVSDKSLKGTLTWTILSWDKQELEKGKKAVSVSPSGIENIFSIKTAIKNPALKFAEATFHLDIPGQEIPDADACWLAPNEMQNDTSLVSETSFGMGAYLGRYHGKELEQMAIKAKESGVKWIREDFEWGGIEPKKGKYNWAFTDPTVWANRIFCVGFSLNSVTVFFLSQL